jgi:general secretion pathway protein L
MNHPIRLVLLAADSSAASPCLLLDAEGRILERRMLSPGAPAAPGPRTVVAVPGERVRTLRLDVPLRHPAQARAAALLQLEGELADDEAPHLALGAIEADGTRLACVADAAQIRAWLAQAEALGIVPDTLVPDHLLLPAAADASTSVAVFEGRWLARGQALAFSAEPALAEAALAGHPHTAPATGEAGLQLLASGALCPPLDLQQFAFAPRRNDDADARRARRRRWLVAALLASPLLLVAAEALRYEISARLLRQRAQALAAEVADPQHARAGPVAATEAQLARLRGTGGFNGLAATLLQAVQAQPAVRIEGMEYIDGRLQALIAHPDAGAANAVLESVRPQATARLEDAAAGGDGPRSLVVLEGMR